MSKTKVEGDYSLADPGAIFCHSWGYDQTNVDYYQVVKRSGTRVYLRPIAASSVAGSEGFMSDSVVPAKDRFIDECRHCRCRESAAQHTEACGAFDHKYEAKAPFFKQVRFYSNEPYLSFDYGWCGLADKKAHYRSWYA